MGQTSDADNIIPEDKTNVDYSDTTETPETSETTLITEEQVFTESEDGLAWVVGKWSAYILFGLVVFLLLLKLLILWRTRRRMKQFGYFRLPYRPVVVGFFHPYCSSGGGGERVLWHSIHALQKRYSFVRCVVYTGDVNMRPKNIVELVQNRFKLSLNNIEFVYLNRRGWVEARRWPRFTIIGQSLGSMILGLEALIKLAPHVYIDTTGYSFTLPLFRWLGGSKTASYVHYPTVSSDMMRRVAKRNNTYNNSHGVSRSSLLTRLKLTYYRLFGCLYGFMGRRSDVVMVNSTWTHNHIRQIWSPKQLFIVYPPCDTSSFEQLPLKRSSKTFRIVSVGQFRPEKNHSSQLNIIHSLLKEDNSIPVTLVLIGSCRNEEDELRVSDLRHRARTLNIEKCVEFKINQSFSNLRAELGRAVAALHTMEDEHFGISLVECMAAGCVMIAHDSGGPQQDIVVDWHGQPTGYLASNEEQFISWLIHVIHMSQREREVITGRARAAVITKFSLDVFEASFLRATEKLFG